MGYASQFGQQRVWQCIHHSNSISVWWLHLHTFCSTGHVDGLPNDRVGYCAQMSSLDDAQPLSEEMTKWTGGHVDPTPSPAPAPRCATTSKKECGFNGITKSTCEQRGCCWQPEASGSGTPWCFQNSSSEALLV